VPPRAGAAASASAETAPTQRDRHLRMITQRGRMAWQKASGYNLRAKVEASIGRYKCVIGDALRSRTGQTEATEVAISWLRVLGTAKMPQIDQSVRHQLHTVVTLLFELKAQQKPFELVFPREGPLHAEP
jgi:hypothetical protein